MTRFFTAIAGLVVMLAPPDVCGTQEHNPKLFAGNVAAHGTELQLAGSGLLKVAYFFSVYHAALYLPPDAGPEDALGDIPRRLEVVYVRSVSKGLFRELADRAMRRYLDARQMAAIRDPFEAMSALYEDARPGDRVSLTYIPGRGTELAINGSVRGLIPGSDFAKAYFGIWLHPQTLNPALRDALLTPRDPSA